MKHALLDVKLGLLFYLQKQIGICLQSVVCISPCMWLIRRRVDTQTQHNSGKERIPCSCCLSCHCFVCSSCDSGGDCECLCTAIAAYAEECNHRGVYIRWRSQELCRMSKTLDAPFTLIHSDLLTWSCLSLFNSLCFPPSFSYAV